MKKEYLSISAPRTAPWSGTTIHTKTRRPTVSTCPSYMWQILKYIESAGPQPMICTVSWCESSLQDFQPTPGDSWSCPQLWDCRVGKKKVRLGVKARITKRSQWKTVVWWGQVRSNSHCSDLKLFLPGTAVQGLTTRRQTVTTMVNDPKSRKGTLRVILGVPCLRATFTNYYKHPSPQCEMLRTGGYSENSYYSFSYYTHCIHPNRKLC